MPLLEAFLALALTMLSLAMIATLIVEFFHRIAKTRAENLKTMLGEFYDSELKAFVAATVKQGADKLEDRAEFIKRMVTNPLVKSKKFQFEELLSLSTEDLFKGLANTKIGKEIKLKVEAEIDENVDRLARSFEAFGVVATDLFKRRAQFISLIAGVAVAIVLNANALTIFESYMDDPQSRAATVAKADVVLESFTNRPADEKGFTNEEEVQKHLDSISDKISELEKTGVPIGYSREVRPINLWYEADKDDTKTADDSKKTLTQPQKVWGTVLWAFGVIGTGLLIGLGAPFWFNIVRKLTDVIQVGRGGTPAAAEPGDSAEALADPMKTHKDTFKMTGGPPPSVKAQANVTALSKAAADADKGAKGATDALMGVRQAAGDSPSNLMKTAIADAEQALEVATDAQKKAYKDKMVAEQSMANWAKTVP